MIPITTIVHNQGVCRAAIAASIEAPRVHSVSAATSAGELHRARAYTGIYRLDTTDETITFGPSIVHTLDIPHMFGISSSLT